MKKQAIFRCSMILSSLSLSVMMSSLLHAADTSPELTGQIRGIPPILKVGMNIAADSPIISQSINGQERKIIKPGSIIQLIVTDSASPLYTYYDQDGDLDALKPIVDWYIVTPKDSTQINWAPFGTELIALTDMMITEQNQLELEKITDDAILENGLALKVPASALGKRIGVSITPRSITGFPIKGVPLFLADLNYAYEQTFETNQPPALETIQSSIVAENFNHGGGYVLDVPSIESINIGIIANKDNQTARVTINYPYSATQYPVTDLLDEKFDDASLWTFVIGNGFGDGCTVCETFSGEINPNDATSGSVPVMEIKLVSNPTIINYEIKARNREGIIGNTYQGFHGVATPNLGNTSFRLLDNADSMRRSVNSGDSKKLVYDVQSLVSDLLSSQNSTQPTQMKLVGESLPYTFYAVPKSVLEANTLTDIDLSRFDIIGQGEYRFESDNQTNENQPFCLIDEENLEKVIVFQMNVSMQDETQGIMVNQTILQSTLTGIE